VDIPIGRTESDSGDDISALDSIFPRDRNRDVGKPECGPHARSDTFDFAIVILRAANFRVLSTRLDQDRIPARKFATRYATGDDCANAAQGKSAIDKQSGLANVARGRERTKFAG